MTENIIEKAEILFLQNRYIDAEKLLKELLSSDPKNVNGLMLLSQVCLALDKTDKANILIDSAIAIDPEYSPLFFVKAKVLIQRDELVEAETNIKHALKLSPLDVDYLSLLASIKFIQQQYKGALRYANKALAIDPSHVASLNTRTSTLLQLDKKEESLLASEVALREAPDNAFSHCNAGWNLVEKGKPSKAMNHFREALKIDPNFAYAKDGMIEALKIKNSFYSFYLKYSNLINNSYSYAPRILLVISIIFFKVIGKFTLVERIAISIVLPALVLIYFFIYSKMVMPPFSNLFLRLNSFARHLFDETDVIVSNIVGICFLIFILGLVLYFALGGFGYLAISIFGFTMMLPCSIMLAHPNIKILMIAYALLLTIVGICSIGLIFLNGNLLNILGYIFIFSFLLNPWVSIMLVSFKAKR